MRMMTITACFIAILVAPAGGWSEDWEQVPSGSDQNQTEAAPSGNEQGGAATEPAGPANGANGPLTEGGGTMEAPPGGAGPGALGALVSHMHAAPGQSGKPCELVGALANIAATLRDRGVPQEQQLKDVDKALNQSVTEEKIPKQAQGPMGGVLHDEIAYVYEHPEMKPDQVRAHWTSVCQTRGTGG